MGFGRLRLTTQLTVLVIVSTLIAMTLVVLILLAQAQTIVEDAIVARNTQLLETTARQLVRPTHESDILAAREVMAPIPHPGSIRRIALYSVTGLFLDQQSSADLPPELKGGDEELARQAIASGAIIQQRAPGLVTLVAPVLDEERGER